MKKALQWILILGSLLAVFFVVKNQIPKTLEDEHTWDAPALSENNKKINSNTDPLNQDYWVKIAGQSILLETVTHTDEMERGLSGRKSLKDNEGMLFVFDNGSADFFPSPKFWMKGMLFPLDIIWIGKNNEVVYIKKNAQPESYPETFGPESSVDSRQVLEVNAGFSDKNNLKVGDKVEFGF